MKLFHSDLRLNIIPCTAYLITFGIGFYLGNFLLHAFSFNRLFLGVVLLLACSPMGKMRFSHGAMAEKSGKEKIRIFLIISAVQLGLTIIFYTFYGSLLHYLPLTEGLSVMTEQQLTAAIIHDLGWQWGLYPWPLVALLSIGLALFYYKKQQPVLMGELIYPYGTQNEAPVRVYTLNVFCIAQATLWIWFTLGGFTLGWVSWVGSYLHFSFYHHLNTKAIVIGLLLIGLHQTPAMKDLQRFICRMTPRHALYGLVYMGFMGFLLLLLNGIFTLAPLSPLSNNNMASLAFHVVAYNDLSTAYRLIAYGWWTMSVPLMAYTFTYYAQGLSIRFILLGALLTPFIINVAMTAFPSLLIWQNLPVLLLGILGFLAVLYTMKDSTFLSSGFLPVPEHFRVRESNKYIATAFSMSTAFILLFIISDGYGLQVIFLLFALCGTFCFNVLSVTTLIHLVTRKRENHELCINA